MSWFYRLAADLILVVHFSYVAFVLVGFLLILVGLLLSWKWTLNPVFRCLHLLAMAIVVAESLLEITCPLTTWENRLRQLAGQQAHEGAFVARWLHQLMFFDFKPWVFTLVYCLLGLAILATFVFAPPRWKRPGGRDASGER